MQPVSPATVVYSENELHCVGNALHCMAMSVALASELVRVSE